MTAFADDDSGTFSKLLQQVEQVHENDIYNLQSQVAWLQQRLRDLEPATPPFTQPAHLISGVSGPSEADDSVDPGCASARSRRASAGLHSSDSSTWPQQSAMGVSSDTPSAVIPVIAGKRTSSDSASNRLSRLDSRTSIGIRMFGDQHQQKGSASLRSIVRSPKFEMLFAVLILMNTIMIALESQYTGMNTGASCGLTPVQYLVRDTGAQQGLGSEVWPKAFEHVFTSSKWMFGIVFTIELIMKLYVSRSAFFKDLMNYLDFCVVAFWLAGAVLEASGLWMEAKLEVARLLRLLKVMRLVRLVRGVRTFDALFMITTAVKTGMTTLFWAAILFTLALTFFALLMTEALKEFYFQDTEQPLEQRKEIYIYFGTFARALFTMFELTFSDYPPVSRLLAEYVSAWFMCLAVLYKLSLGFAVVGVVNGVLVQETFKVAASDDSIMVRQKEMASKAHRKKMAKLFESADATERGYITCDDMTRIFQDATVRKWLHAMGFPACTTTHDVNNLFSEIDEECRGQVAFEDFVRGISNLGGSARSFDLITLKRDVSEIRELLKVLKEEGDTSWKGKQSRFKDS